jgi:hypothetical protein
MEGKIVIPKTVNGFKGYIDLAYETATKNETAYGIDPIELAKVKPLYENYVSLQIVFENIFPVRQCLLAIRTALTLNIES